MESKLKLKHIQFTEPIKFWTWVNLKKLAVVTGTSVYHIDITVSPFHQTNNIEN